MDCFREIVIAKTYLKPLDDLFDNIPYEMLDIVLKEDIFDLEWYWVKTYPWNNSECPTQQIQSTYPVNVKWKI